MKTKTASVRLPKEMFEEIDNICDGVGCSRNDWIKDKLREGIREESNENSQDQENIPGPDDNRTPKKITIRDIPEPKIEIRDVKEPQIIKVDFNPSDYEVDSEPKPTLIKIPTSTVKEIPQDNSNKPRVDHVLFNGKYIPKAEVYEI